MLLKYYLHLCLSFSLMSASDEFARTENGLVRGYKMRHANHISYLGIPYAVAPVGQNRFKPPKPALNWSGIYEANHTVECPQRESVNEDCLVVNVFTPLTRNKDYIPVIFYIHGGAYILGKGPTEGFDPLIEKNIIVVTFNYRLGALGFLCLGSDLAPGNAGLMDQMAALKWVHRNIKGFGGDPKQVTIYGTSAGASSAELLLLNQNAEKEEYFHQVIMESGSALDVWAVDKRPLVTATKVYLNAISSEKYKTVNTTDLENFFSVVKPSILNKATMKYYNSLTDGTFGFAPCVEKKSDGEKNQFMIIYPKQKLHDHNFKHVPMMVLYSSLEGLYITNDDFHKINNLQSIKDNFIEFLPADLQFDSCKTKKIVANLVQNFYMKSSKGNMKENLGLLHFLGDSMVLFGVIDSVFEHRKKNRVYLMEFSYKGAMGLTNEEKFKDIDAAGHAELKYYAILNKTIQSNEDKLMVDKVSTLLTNFVKFGSPTPTMTELVPFIWPPAPSDKLTYLMLGNDTALLNDPYAERMALWRQLYKKFGH